MPRFSIPRRAGRLAVVAFRLFIALPPLTHSCLASLWSTIHPLVLLSVHFSAACTLLVRATSLAPTPAYPTARQNQPWLPLPLSLRLSLVLYPGWVPILRPWHAAQFRSTGHWCVDLISLQAEPAIILPGVSSPPRRTTRHSSSRAHQRPPSVIVNPAVAVPAPLPRSSSSPPLRPCHATRRLALQLAAGTGGSFTSTISGSLMSPVLPIPPIAPYSLLSPKGG